MYRIEYYNSETGEVYSEHKLTLDSAKKVLDDYIDMAPGDVKRVMPLRVDFKNGDFVRIDDISPRSAMMMPSKIRGFGGSSSDPDSIFDI